MLMGSCVTCINSAMVREML